MRSYILMITGFVLTIGLFSCQKKETRQKPIILYDQYHHQKLAQKAGHAAGWYAMDDTTGSGYSRIFDALSEKYQIKETQEKITNEALKDVSVLIIVNPDVPKYVPEPNYVEDQEIETIVSFVQAGGGLLVIGNSSGEVEIEHLNKLLQKFGFKFNDDTTGAIVVDIIENQFIKNVPSFTYWDGCTMNLLPESEEYSVETVLKVKDPSVKPIIVLSKYGKGKVIAVGDAGCFLNNAIKTIKGNLEIFVQLVDLVTT